MCELKKKKTILNLVVRKTQKRHFKTALRVSNNESAFALATQHQMGLKWRLTRHVSLEVTEAVMRKTTHERKVMLWPLIGVPHGA